MRSGGLGSEHSRAGVVQSWVRTQEEERVMIGYHCVFELDVNIKISSNLLVHLMRFLRAGDQPKLVQYRLFSPTSPFF